MNDEQFRSLVADLTQPVYEQLIDTVVTFVKQLVSSMPKEMPVSEQTRIVTELLKSHSETIQKNIERSVPTDFADKLKEVIKNGK